MSRKRLAMILGAITTAAVVILVTLIQVQVPRHFELRSSITGDADAYCFGNGFPKGPNVTFQWWAPSSVMFGVAQCTFRLGMETWGTDVYEAKGTSGAGSFVSQGGTYDFYTWCVGAITNESDCIQANVSGNYTSPLLVL